MVTVTLRKNGEEGSEETLKSVSQKSKKRLVVNRDLTHNRGCSHMCRACNVFWDVSKVQITHWHPWSYTVLDIRHVSLVGVWSIVTSCSTQCQSLPPLAVWPSCPITSSFTSPMGSCIHTTAPGWAPYGPTYQPIQSPECREREAALWNECLQNEWDGEKWRGAYVCERQDNKESGRHSFCDSRNLRINMWNLSIF